jgi:hypothetical protein
MLLIHRADFGKKRKRLFILCVDELLGGGSALWGLFSANEMLDRFPPIPSWVPSLSSPYIVSSSLPEASNNDFEGLHITSFILYTLYKSRAVLKIGSASRAIILDN